MPTRGHIAMQRGLLLPLLRARVTAGGSDRGFTLIEALAAFVVFGIFMTGLTTAMITLSKTLLRTRIRSAAVSVAQQQIEKARALAYGNLALNEALGFPSGDQPLTDGAGAPTYPVDHKACSICLAWHPTPVHAAGTTFDVEQVVLDGGTATGDSGQTLIEKYLRVIVTWASPTTGKVDMVTTFNNPAPLPPSQEQGIDITAVDASVSPAQVIGTTPDDPEVFDVTISNATGDVATAPMDEGGYVNRTIAAGTYTCTVKLNPTTLQSWKSFDSGTGYMTDTFTTSCTVQANKVTTLQTHWVPSDSCPTSSSKGSLAVTVTDTSGNPVSGVNVQPQDANNLSNKPGAKKTDSSGLATFTGLTGDPYYYAVNGVTGYQNSGQLGPVCVYPGGTATAQATLSPNPTGDTMTIQVVVKNSWPSSNAYTIIAEYAGQQTRQTMALAKGQQLTATFDSMPVGNGYAVTLCRMEQTGNCNQINYWSNLNYSVRNTTYKTQPSPYVDQPPPA